jgi:hypothetical protein
LLRRFAERPATLVGEGATGALGAGLFGPGVGRAAIDVALDPHAVSVTRAAVMSAALRTDGPAIDGPERTMGPAYVAAYADPMGATRSDTIYTVLPFVVVVMLTAGFAVVFLQRAAMRRSVGRRIVEADVATHPRDAPPRPARPWWGNPLLWLGVCGVFVVLGFVVWPGLFGGTFVFLPFVWVWRPRREPKLDPRTNGHSRRGDKGSFTGA